MGTLVLFSLKRDNMIEYEFYLNEIGTPQFLIKGGLDGLSELGSCENYIEIVMSLEQVLAGKLERYNFGYEVYMIECKKEISKVIDTFDGWKVVAEIPTQEVYELMRDWRDYLIEWETNNKIK
jgi:hypothetical protein